jgi:hypothetical protein
MSRANECREQFSRNPLNFRRIQGKRLSPHAFPPVRLTRLIFHLVVINFPRSPMGCSLFHFLGSEVGRTSLILPCVVLKTASQSRIGVRALKNRKTLLFFMIVSFHSQSQEIIRRPHPSLRNDRAPCSPERKTGDIKFSANHSGMVLGVLLTIDSFCGKSYSGSIDS